MQQQMGLTYLFIAHDLSVVRHISNRIGVMYLGSLVELGESYELNRHPIHPYTQTLLSAVPVPDRSTVWQMYFFYFVCLLKWHSVSFCRNRKYGC